MQPQTWCETEKVFIQQCSFISHLLSHVLKFKHSCTTLCMYYIYIFSKAHFSSYQFDKLLRDCRPTVRGGFLGHTAELSFGDGG